MAQTRFKFKVELVQTNGVTSALYTDDLQVIDALKTINNFCMKVIIVYDEIKEGLDWKERERFDVTYDAKKVKKNC